MSDRLRDVLAGVLYRASFGKFTTDDYDRIAGQQVVGLRRAGLISGEGAVQSAPTGETVPDQPPDRVVALAASSRDTEIERIAAVLADPTVMRRLLYERLDDAAAALYDAGLRSQPASEPSLDVAGRLDMTAALAEWVEAAQRVIDRDGAVDWDDSRRIAESVAAQLWNYLSEGLIQAPGLSQPADNEAAE